MRGIIPAQIRKIHALSRERGLDGDTLHAHVYKLTKKESIKELTIMEAIKVIDGLQDGGRGTDGMATFKQKGYINGLLIEIGWVDEAGKADKERFRRWIKDKFHVEHERWLTVQSAQKVIEALKDMCKRKRETGAV